MADAAPPPCPICRRAADAKFRPFCSKRCADVDLQRWLTGRYAVPTEDGESDEEPRGDAGQGPDGNL